jgi:aryl-alcohol dehydrogenase-like predicted oxidoreductase
MEYRQMGNSDLRVSAVTMGCWAIAGDWVWGPQDENEALAALHEAVECGINSFDTAEGYGNGDSERLVGRGLAAVRHKVIIATKIPSAYLQAADVRAHCEASLQRLGSDYIDIYYVHWPNWEIPFAETAETLERLKTEGKIRHIGCSNFGVRDLTDWLTHTRSDINQLAYNLLFRPIEDEILPTCVQHNVGVACYSPLMEGLLTGKFATADDVPAGRARTRQYAGSRPLTRHGEAGAETQTFAAIAEIRRICAAAGAPMAQASLAWLLAQRGVSTVVAGARSPAQVRQNAAAGSLRLPPDVLAALTQATEPLNAALGPNADMWQAPSRIR